VIAALVAAPAVMAADASSSGGLPDWVTLLITLIVALGGGGGMYQILTIRATKRNVSAGTDKMKVDAVDVLTGTALELIVPLKEEVARLSQQVKTLETKLQEERNTADIRIRQLQDDIAERERHIRVQDAEIIELRTRIKSSPGWPGQA